MFNKTGYKTPDNSRYLILAIVSVVLFLSILNWTGAFNIAEMKSLDLLFKLRGNLKPNTGIAVVAIDDQTFTELGMDWPLANSLHAQVISRLQSDGAQFVGIVFPLATSPRDNQDDKYLVNALNKTGVVWLPEEFSETRDSFYSLQSLTEPPAIFGKAAAGAAFINLIRDTDGSVRRLSLIYSHQGKSYNHMVQAAYLNTQAGAANNTRSSNLIINYAGPSRTYTSVSYYQVLEGLLPAGYFRDKIVFITLDSPDIGDSFITPFPGRGQMSRGEIMANGLENLISRNDIKAANLPLSVLLVLFIATTGTITTVKQPLLRSSLLIVGIGGIYCLGTFLLFRQMNVWLPVVYPILTLAVIYGSSTLYRYNLERRQKRELRSLFSRYVSEEVVQEVLELRDAQILGGKRQEITVLFSDIRGFTALSQKMVPEAVVNLLNEYLTAMTAVIFQNKGTIDKFLGDGIMVLFGAPVNLPDAPVRALNTAMQMQQKMHDLRSRWLYGDHPALNMGIGIHTGEAVIGNIGSSQRMNYTAIGDTVNIASRLQELTKTHGHNIIVSEATVQRIQQPPDMKPLGPVILRGRDEQINIYGVVLPDME